MTLKHVLGIAAVILSFSNMSIYIYSIIAGKIKPHAFSWLLWALIMGIVFAAQYANRAGSGSWQTGVAACMCLIIGVLSLFYGERQGTKSDWIAVAIVLFSIPLWMLTNDALLSVFLLTIMDAISYYPTLRKAYNLPHEESLYRPFQAIFGYLTGFFAIEYYDLTTAFYPAFMVAVEAMVAMTLLWRRRAVAPLHPQ